MDNQEVINIFMDKCKPFGEPIVICEVGSRAYGLSTPESDFDYRAVFLPNIEYLIGLKKVEQIQIKEEDWVATELRRFCSIIIKQNPTMLEMLYIDAPIYETDIWRELKTELKKLVTKKAFIPYNAYVQSQKLKLINRNPIAKRKDLIDKFGYDVKFSSHMLRLSVQCQFLMRDGYIPVKVPEPYRSLIMEVKNGQWTKELVLKYAEELDKESYTAYQNSKLPETCDVEVFERDCLIPLLHDDMEYQYEKVNEKYIRGYEVGKGT